MWHHSHHRAFLILVILFHCQKREGKKIPNFYFFFLCWGHQHQGGSADAASRFTGLCSLALVTVLMTHGKGGGKQLCAQGRNVCKPKKSHVQAGSVLWPGAPAASGSERLRLQARSLGTGKKEAASASVQASSREELAAL